MAAPVQTKIFLSSGELCDLKVFHVKNDDHTVQRTYECWSKNPEPEVYFDFSYAIKTSELALESWSSSGPAQHSDLALLAAEESYHRGFGGRFTVKADRDSLKKAWLGLPMRIEPNGDDGYRISLYDRSETEKRIKEHPMIHPKFFFHLKQVADATLKGELVAEAPPENRPLPAGELPPGDDDNRGWFGRAFTYVFCFEWAIDLWNFACGY